MNLLPEVGTIVLYDTEFTSWPGFMEQGFKAPGRYPEIIQIGAMRLDAAAGFSVLEDLEALVIPRVNPNLSNYIIELTGITQARLDSEGVPFADAQAAFLEFIGDDYLCAFGFDGMVMAKNCMLNDLPVPDVFAREINLKELMIRDGLILKDLNSSDLPGHFGLAPETRRHDALADVRAVARVLGYLRRAGPLC